MTSPQSTAKLAVLMASAAGATAATAYYAYRRHCQIVQQVLARAEERRKEERTGRIRAEVKLRSINKEMEALEMAAVADTVGNSDLDGVVDNAEAEVEGADTDQSKLCLSSKEKQQEQRRNKLKLQKLQDPHRMMLQCIGTVVSPYTKRMGTPRQGSLVPSSRAFVDLNIPMEALDGMESYSHVWIIFAFHANTNTFHKKTKVRPPRAVGNEKVGQLATRSPHRPNPLGLSLVKMEHLDQKRKRLHISGIDLVNGTPVYDVKPCVPWDIPGQFLHNNSNNNGGVELIREKFFRVPDWVDQNDSIATVTFTEQAEASLERLVVEEKRLAPLYNKKNDVQAARATLMEILAQDPRSSHKGLKINQRGSNSNINNGNAKAANTGASGENERYNLVFGKTQVEFQVLLSGVQVESINPVDFDEEAYVEGIPLISEQNKNETAV